MKTIAAFITIAIIAIYNIYGIETTEIQYTDAKVKATEHSYDKLGLTTFTIYETVEDINFTFNGKDYVIPKGFHSDLATIPHFIWNIVSPEDLTTAATIHDWIYVHIAWGDIDITQDEADAIFKTIVKDEFGYANIISTGQRFLGSILTPPLEEQIPSNTFDHLAIGSY